MKKGKIIIGGIMLVVVLAAAFIYFCVPISTGGSAPEWQPALAADVVLTAEQVSEDRDAAIKFVEDVHPYFALVDDQTAYAQAKQQFENATAGEMSVGELQTAVAEYLCFFCRRTYAGLVGRAGLSCTADGVSGWEYLPCGRRQSDGAVSGEDWRREYGRDLCGN